MTLCQGFDGILWTKKITGEGAPKDNFAKTVAMFGNLCYNGTHKKF